MNKMISSNFKILSTLLGVLVLSAESLLIDTHQRSSQLHLNYKDNLEALNWYYGSITPVDYRLRIFKAATNQTLDLCPISAPYSTADMTQCESCPPQKPLRNLASSVCQPCPTNYSYSPNIGNCSEVPRTVQPQSTSNTTTVTTTNTNQSTSVSIPINQTTVAPTVVTPTGTAPTAPAVFVNGSTVNSSSTTNPTSNTTAVNVTNNTTSTNATSNTTTTNTSTSNKSTVNSTGPAANTTTTTNTTSTVVNSTNTSTGPLVFNNSQASQPTNTNTTTVTNTSITASTTNATKPTTTTTPATNTTTTPSTNTTTTPATNTTINTSTTTTTTTNTTVVPVIGTNSSTGTLTYNCSGDKPRWNPTSNACETCPNATEYINNTNVCLPIIYVANLKDATNLIQPTPGFTQAQIDSIKAQNPTRNTQACPKDKPYLSVTSGTGVCVGCPADQYWSTVADKCIQGCPVGTIYNKTTAICQIGAFLTNPEASNLISPTGKYDQWKAKQEQLKNSTTNAQYCASDTPYEVNNVCIKCEGETPYFNIESSKCSGCSTRRYYSGNDRRCIADYTGGTSLQRMIANIL